MLKHQVAVCNSRKVAPRVPRLSSWEKVAMEKFTFYVGSNMLMYRLKMHMRLYMRLIYKHIDKGTIMGKIPGKSSSILQILDNKKAFWGICKVDEFQISSGFTSKISSILTQFKNMRVFWTLLRKNGDQCKHFSGTLLGTITNAIESMMTSELPVGGERWDISEFPGRYIW